MPCDGTAPAGMRRSWQRRQWVDHVALLGIRTSAALPAGMYTCQQMCFKVAHLAAPCLLPHSQQHASLAGNLHQQSTGRCQNSVKHDVPLRDCLQSRVVRCTYSRNHVRVEGKMLMWPHTRPANWLSLQQLLPPHGQERPAANAAQLSTRQQRTYSRALLPP